jgi:hypothetical protein
MNVANCVLALALAFMLGRDIAAHAASEVLRLRGPVTIASPETSPAVRSALRDLGADFAAVLGQRPTLVQGQRGTVLVRLDRALKPAESWRIDVAPAGVTITGADTLGAVFGIYRFSQQWLGVDPLWFWKDLRPPRREELVLPRQSLTSTAPVFRYRGWFVNDEDLLTEWKPGGGQRSLDYPFYQQVIAPQVADRVFEALLRSGGNLVIPASFVDVMNPPEAALLRHAVERGLYVTQHHVEPMGVSHFAFETYWQRQGEKVAFSYAQDPDRVRRTWTAYARRWRELAGDQVVWQLGLRGRGDRPIWTSDRTVREADAGTLVSRAIADQWSIVRAVDPRPAPPATTTLWMEGSQLMQRGLLKFPPGVTIVFADEGRTQMLQDDFRLTARVPQHTYGVYYHLAFWQEGPHLVQGTQPARIKRNFDALCARGDTQYAIVNVSNVREHVLGIAAAMEIMQSGSAWDDCEFLHRWAGPALHDAYRELLASFVALPGAQLLQDGTCHAFAKQLLVALKKRKTPPHMDCAPPQLVAGLAGAIARLDRLLAAYPTEKIPADRRAFYDFHFRVQAAMLRQYYAYLRELLRSLDDRQHLHAAAQELERLLAVRQPAAVGRWADWYRGDKKENLPALLETTRSIAP